MDEERNGGGEMSYAGDFGPVSDRENDGQEAFPEDPCPGCGALDVDDCECEPADSEMAQYIAVVGDVEPLTAGDLMLRAVIAESEIQSDEDTRRANAAFDARYCSGEEFTGEE